MFAQCLRNVCAVKFAQCLRNVCARFVQDLRSVCARFAHVCACLRRAWYLSGNWITCANMGVGLRMFAHVCAWLRMVAYIVRKHKSVCALFAHVCAVCACLRTGQLADVTLWPTAVSWTPPRRRHHPSKTTRRQVHLSISVWEAYTTKLILHSVSC